MDFADAARQEPAVPAPSTSTDVAPSGERNVRETQVDHADVEVGRLTGNEDTIEIVPVNTMNGHFLTDQGTLDDGTPQMSRVFSPEGTEYMTPANSPPVDYQRDDNQNLVELTEAADLKRLDPDLARATEEDEFRKIQELEDEIRSGKSFESEPDEIGLVRYQPDESYQPHDDRLDDFRQQEMNASDSDVMFPVDDVTYPPPSVEYHDDRTPVPEVSSDQEKKSNHSSGSRPDNVPVLVCIKTGHVP